MHLTCNVLESLLHLALALPRKEITIKFEVLVFTFGLRHPALRPIKRDPMLPM